MNLQVYLHHVLIPFKTTLMSCVDHIQKHVYNVSEDMFTMHKWICLYNVWRHITTVFEYMFTPYLGTFLCA